MAEINTADKTGHLLDYTLLEQLDHGLLVSHLASHLGRRLGCTDEEVQSLALAGILHDIGKIRLSRYVENGTSMTVEEIKYVRMHSMFGCAILKRQGFSEKIQEMVLYHHENYDGTGYPANLAGEKIPFGARILRICDVYCALTSDRPYRSAFTREQAMELMTEEVKNFDLKMFLAFQRVIHSGSRKAIELSDVDELIREIIKEKTENGIKKETGYRNERYFTERNGNP